MGDGVGVDVGALSPSAGSGPAELLLSFERVSAAMAAAAALRDIMLALEECLEMGLSRGVPGFDVEPGLCGVDCVSEERPIKNCR